MNRLTALAAAALLATGCADRGIVDVSPQQTDLPNAALAGVPWNPGLTVMTWNVYYGTDPTPLLLAPADQVPFVAAEVWALVQQTNFPQRAGALARAIAAHQPELVGLQEAALYRIQSPGDIVLGGTTPATQVVYDFLQLLVDSLAARGLVYVIAAADSTTDIEVPVFNPSNGYPLPFDDVRLTDRDAVLARADVQIANPQHGVYVNRVPIAIGPFQTGIYEGWSSVEATVHGRTYRFVSTHLEAQPFMPIPVLQAQELIALLQNETRPTILVGDFNSDVSGIDPANATPSYGMLTDAGFQDTWLQHFRSPAGLTCCQSDNLLNRFSTFDQRIDFIFTRNMPNVTPASTLVLARKVVGDQRGDRTRSGLWPSDHGGVVATLLVPPVGPRTGVAE
jgi:endonuclease/exonuclease/phosphatase (EEP) superfamily protein YafD